MDIEINKLVNRIERLAEIDENTDKLYDELYELVEKRLDSIIVEIKSSIRAGDCINNIEWIVDDLIDNPTKTVAEIIADDIEDNPTDYLSNDLYTDVYSE